MKHRQQAGTIEEDLLRCVCVYVCLLAVVPGSQNMKQVKQPQHLPPAACLPAACLSVCEHLT